MSVPIEVQERWLLHFSAWMGVFFAVLGIGWGVAIGSGIILFDGIYSGFSIILSVLSIAVLGALRRADDERFPFGRAVFEPLIVGLKSITIIGVCAYAALKAVIDMLSGALSTPASSLGMLYSVIAVVACAFSWLYLRFRGRDLPDLVKAEAEQWLIDTVFSGIVLLSFLASYVLSRTRLAGVVPYIDPGMVVVVSLFLIWVPLRRFLLSLREILMMAPAPTLREELEGRTEAIAKAHGFSGASLRSAKIGRELVVDVTFIAPNDMGPLDLAQLDEMRAQVEQQLAAMGYGLYMNVQFTKDRYWA